MYIRVIDRIFVNSDCKKPLIADYPRKPPADDNAGMSDELINMRSRLKHVKPPAIPTNKTGMAVLPGEEREARKNSPGASWTPAAQKQVREGLSLINI